MHDTSPEVEKQLRELYAQRTPGERVVMATQMFDAGITLMKAGILRQHPDITETEMRWKVFQRLYGDCYSEEEQARIRVYLCGG